MGIIDLSESEERDYRSLDGYDTTEVFDMIQESCTPREMLEIAEMIVSWVKDDIEN